jgi:LuxR family transcriptional regulator, maltose regulon positive regulatory protein
MDIPLIATKLYIPQHRHESLPRPRLEQWLNERLMRKLTLISAPAGFGKTTLAINWLSQNQIPIAWYSLDENDNHLIRFFSYFIAALQRVNKSFGQNLLEELNTAYSVDFETIMTHLINDFMKIEQEVALVLDDYHLIHQPEINQAVAFLLDHLPPHLRIVILSRTTPLLPIAKLRSKSQLTELHASDLKFTLEETRNFLSQTMKLNLTRDEIEVLENKTEGWVVGLQLAALSIPHSISSKEFIKEFSGSDRYVTDFLIDEVVSGQTREIQQFLFRTSFLERFCAGLCEAITGGENDRMILEMLETSNLFILPLDNQRKWYRYHYLFADLLQSRFKSEFPQKSAEVYLKAHHWYAKEGLFEEAIRSAIKGNHFVQAAETINKLDIQVYWCNERLIARDWLNALPDELILSDSWLSILLAYITLSEGRLRDSEMVFDQALSDIVEKDSFDNARNSMLRGVILAAKSIFSYHHHMNWNDALSQVNLALRLIPTELVYDRCLAYLHGGGALIQFGELTQAEEYLLYAFDLTQKNNSSGQKLLTLGNLGQLKLIQGKLHQAATYWQEAYHYAKSLHKVADCSLYTHVLVGLGNLYYEWNQLDTAAEFLKEAIEITPRNGGFLDRILICHTAAIQLACGRQQYKKAKRILQKTKQMVLTIISGDIMVRRIELLEINIALAEQDLDMVSSWVDRFDPGLKKPITFELEPELVTWIRFLLKQKETQTAIPWLISLISLAKQQKRIKSLIQLEVLLAKAHYIEKDSFKGIERLTIALKLAEPEGFVRSFLDEGQPIKFLLSELLRTGESMTDYGISSKYIQSLLGGFDSKLSGTDTKKRISDEFSDQLTPREKEILPHLAKGFSYANIADQLSISKNTVRFHVKNIYEKFQVNNRTQAITAAQKYHLI